MTTIAYKDGKIATDGQFTCGDTILTLNGIKQYEHKGSLFFLSGPESEMHEFMSAWPNGKIRKSVDVMGFVINRNILYAACNDDGKVATWEHDRNLPWAYGSGAHFAIGAMDAGASAFEAVRIAIGRDIGSGGIVRQYTAAIGGPYSNK